MASSGLGGRNVQRWQWEGPTTLSARRATTTATATTTKRQSPRQRGLLLLVAINALALSDYLLEFGLISSPRTTRGLQSIENKRQLHRELCSEGSAAVGTQQQLGDMTLSWGQLIAQFLRRLSSPFRGVDDDEERRRLASGCNFTDYIYLHSGDSSCSATDSTTDCSAVDITHTKARRFI